MMRRAFYLLAASLLVASASRPGVACPRATCTDPTVNCVTFNQIGIGPDPGGFGTRLAAELHLKDGVEGGQLRGVVRWYLDGEVVGDSEVVPHNFGFDYSSILFLPESAILSGDPASEIFAEYLGDEDYGGTGLPFGEVLRIGFEASSCLGTLGPFNPSAIWNPQIEVSPPEIEFAASFGALTRWDAPDHDLNPLTGRFILLEGHRPLAEGSIQEKTGVMYHPKVRLSSAMGLGTHTFDALYLGPEGALSIANSQVLTVRHPRRPIDWSISPRIFVATIGTSAMPKVCGRSRNGNRPFRIDGRSVTVLVANDLGADVLGPVLISLDSHGCGEIQVGSVPVGTYEIRTRFEGNARYQDGTTNGVMMIVPNSVVESIQPVVPEFLGTGEARLEFIAPAPPRDNPSIESDPGYERVPSGVVLQCKVSSAEAGGAEATGVVTLLINSWPVMSRNLGASPYSFVTFGPLNLPPGSYAASMAYSGDNVLSPQQTPHFEFSVNQNGRPSFSTHPDLVQTYDGVDLDFELRVAIDVATTIAGLPVVVTGSLVPLPNRVLKPGIPSGQIKFYTGTRLLGSSILHGFRASILLPNGLPLGDFELTAEYYQ